MTISIDNIEDFVVPLDSYISNWLFTNDINELANAEDQKKIYVLTKKAANFLWNYELKPGIECSEKYYRHLSKFNSEKSEIQIIKNYLCNLGIPNNHKVFLSIQPDKAFVLTWEMVIKYAHRLFRVYDLSIWDKTLNWKLEFRHFGEFTFGKDLKLVG